MTIQQEVALSLISSQIHYDWVKVRTGQRYGSQEGTEVIVRAFEKEHEFVFTSINRHDGEHIAYFVCNYLGRYNNDKVA